MKKVALFAIVKNPKLRLYFLGAFIYVVIASIILIPVIKREHTEQVVKAQLSQTLKQNQKKNYQMPRVSGTPVSISISRLGINLPIAPGEYNPRTHTWTLNSRDVFTDNNIDPNPIISTEQARTTFLYGHDIPGVLVKTSELVFGDRMTLTTNNGYAFNYYYDNSAVVAPTDTSIINQPNTGDPVELMTCTGIWYQSRHVMYFRLLSVNKVTSTTTAKGPTS